MITNFFKQLILMSFLMVSVTFLATEKAKEIKEITPVAVTAAAKMAIIKKWDDVTPFADQIVVYEATTLCVTGGDAGYSLHQDQSKRIGYISKSASDVFDRGAQSASWGYKLQKLLKKGTVPMFYYLTTLAIQDNENQAILMRKATAQEQGEILQAVQHNKAEFEYMSFCGQGAMDALKR